MASVGYLEILALLLLLFCDAISSESPRPEPAIRAPEEHPEKIVIEPPKPGSRKRRKSQKAKPPQKASRTVELHLPTEGQTDVIPESFDARKEWPECASIGHIRDQGSCGNCYAAAISGVLSDRLCIFDVEDGTEDPFTGSLSMNQVSSCHDLKRDPLENCNRGSNPETVLPFIAMFGVVSGGDYGTNAADSCVPYPGDPNTYKPVPMKCATECVSPKYRKKFSADTEYIDSYWVYSQAQGTVMEPAEIKKVMELMQRDIMYNGPLTASIAMFDDAQGLKSTYKAAKDGVYTRKDSNGAKTNHRIRIIGWGVYGTAKVPYWLVANSYGPLSGDAGFVLIERGKNTIGIESAIAAPIVKSEDWTTREEFCDVKKKIDQAVWSDYTDPKAPVYILKGEFVMPAKFNQGKVVTQKGDPEAFPALFVHTGRSAQYYTGQVEGFWVFMEDFTGGMHCTPVAGGPFKNRCVRGMGVSAPGSHIAHVCAPSKEGAGFKAADRICWSYNSKQPEKLFWSDKTVTSPTKVSNGIKKLLTDVFATSVDAMLYLGKYRIAVFGTTAAGQFVAFMNFPTEPTGVFKLETTGDKVTLIPVKDFVTC